MLLTQKGAGHVKVGSYSGVAAQLLQSAVAQNVAPRPPVIDMHVHRTNTSPQAVAALNLRYVFLSGLAEDLPKWAETYKSGYLPTLVFPCGAGHAPIPGRSCLNTMTDFPDVSWLRKELESGGIKAFGELSLQYEGISPQDSPFEPFWQLAEEFNIPVGIHMGPGPPGAAYDSNRVAYKSPEYRMAFRHTMLLEEVFLRHKRVRIFVMHAGWAQLDSIIALMYAQILGNRDLREGQRRNEVRALREGLAGGSDPCSSRSLT